MRLKRLNGVCQLRFLALQSMSGIIMQYGNVVKGKNYEILGIFENIICNGDSACI